MAFTFFFLFFWLALCSFFSFLFFFPFLLLYFLWNFILSWVVLLIAPWNGIDFYLNLIFGFGLIFGPFFHFFSIVFKGFSFARKRTFFKRSIGLKLLSILQITFLRILRLTNLNKLPTTIPLMFLPPRICRLRLSIHGPLDIAIERRSFSANPIAPPNMSTVGINLISEIVINGDTEFSNFVDVVHDVLKLLAVAAFFKTSLRVGDKQVGVNHFVQNSLFQLIRRPILKQRLRQLDTARPKPLILTGTGTQGHLRRPLNSTLFQNAIKKELIVVLEESVDVIDGVDILGVEVGVGGGHWVWVV